ncbi:MAG: transcriptional regulator [Planctomycetes bacterium]|nr:transcriptional regulator [Planctomycetota bacterium]
MSRELDPVIHQTTRLRLMAVICHLEEGDSIDFTALKKELALTDGNLGAQLTKLEEAKYLKIKKGFVGRRPRTQVQATPRGRAAFAGHCEALRQIIDESS